MAQVANDSSIFNVWRVSDTFDIQISRKAVAQLAALVSLAEYAAPECEVRGFLVGQSIGTTSRTTLVEQAVLIPANESTFFDAAGRKVIGFFRLEREGNLNFGSSDLNTYGRQLCESGNVGLLIRTSKQGVSKAALFYWQSGAAYPCDLGFAIPMNTAPAASAQVAASPVSRIRWARLAPTAALVIVAMLALQMASNFKPEAPALGTKGLGLTVASQPHQLDIRWNSELPAIVEGETGVMKITDAGTTQAVPFDQNQLRDGHIAYAPATHDVSIDFEAAERDGASTKESVQTSATR